MFRKPGRQKAALTLLVFIFLALINFQLPAIQTVLADEEITAPYAPPDPFKNYLALGLGGYENDWFDQAGVPFDFRYQYLVGDVNNAAANWINWSGPNGIFATYFMNDNRDRNVTPVFTFYMMVSSTPNAYNESATPSKLNNANTMKNYFGTFKTLMQRINEFNQPVIVHVEPDMWGFLQRTNANPAAIPAQVNSSGFGDVATGKADNLTGFAQTLVALRDNYAPKVTLGYHMSGWASGFDVSLNTDTGLNLNSLADSMVNFYNGLGANFDVMFWDTSDRDAGYYAQWDGGAHFWDTANVTLPHFKQYATFLNLIYSKTGKKNVLWQTPYGNSTLNNTTNRWKDNRVEYFIGNAGAGYVNNLKDFTNAGVVAIMFGAGQGDQTTESTDGGVFKNLAKNYYNTGGVPLSQLPPPPQPEGLFHIVSPFRIYNSSTSNVLHFNAIERKIKIVGGSIPSGAKATLGNVTSVKTSGGGNLALYPFGVPYPQISSLNWYRADQIVTNFAVTTLSLDGAITVRNDGSNSHVIYDAGGYIDPNPTGGGSFRAVNPTRLYDSRNTPEGKLKFGDKRSIQVRGAAGVPNQASAVAVNITATGNFNGGYLSLYPSGGQTPNSSTVNWGPPLNGIRSGDYGNFTIVPIGADGKISVLAGGNLAGNTDQISSHFIIDVYGYIDPTQTSTNWYRGITDTRIVSTRDNLGGTKYQPNDERTVQVTGSGKVEKIPAGATAVVVNAKVNDTRFNLNGGWIALFPADKSYSQIGISTVNWSKGSNAASNFAIIPLSADGKIKIRISDTSAHVYIDVVGYIK
jgi:hypothetical protein